MVVSYLEIVSVAATAYFFWLLTRHYIRRSPLNNLHGPPPPSVLLGWSRHCAFFDIQLTCTSGHVSYFAKRDGHKWWMHIAETYGSVARLQAFFGVSEQVIRSYASMLTGQLQKPLLYTYDPKAMHTVLVKNVETFPKITAAYEYVQPFRSEVPFVKHSITATSPCFSDPVY